MHYLQGRIAMSTEKEKHTVESIGELTHLLVKDWKGNIKLSLICGFVAGGLLGGCGSLISLIPLGKVAKPPISEFFLIGLYSSILISIWVYTWALPLSTIYESYVKRWDGESATVDIGRFFGAVVFIFVYSGLWYGVLSGVTFLYRLI